MFCVAELFRRFVATSSAAALFAASLPLQAHAQSLPTNGNVASGAASIGAPTNGNLTINQSSNRAVINWNSFSIGAGNSVTFNQPGSSSAVLNRVTGSTTSSIAGRLAANGQVFLVNPNGIAITPTGTVEVGGGFVGSSLNIRNSDFMNGNLVFHGTGGAVSNAGSISVGSGGFAALLGGSVANSGTITVPQGRIAMGAGSRATLDLTGDGFLQIASAGAGKGDGSGGTRMTGAQLREAVRNVVNMPASAQVVSGRHGRIAFGGGGPRYAAPSRAPVAVANAGAVTNSGTLNASGGTIVLAGRSVTIDKGSLSTASRDAKGGAIVLSATESIALLSANLDASGATSGGSIKIGGDVQGTGALVHAQSTSIDATSTIRADATTSGNGGQIVVWSDGTTTVKGLLSALGAGPGNGGLIETSGHTVDFEGIRVSAAARGTGVAGTWLVDPEDLVVTPSDAATIVATLNGGTDVTLTTTANTASGPGQRIANGKGDITIDAPITWGKNTLTLNAFHDIVVNRAMNLGGTAGLSLNASNALAIKSKISVTGAGSVSLAYNIASLTNLSFGLSSNGFAGSVDYGATNNGGKLNINGTPYSLIYTLQQLQDIQRNTIANYALATNIDATNSQALNSGAGFTPIGGFAGTFDGLGHTIANMSMNRTELGVFSDQGTNNRANFLIRDLGVVNANFSGGSGGILYGFYSAVAAPNFVWTYTTGTIQGGSVGGLAGGMSGNIDSSFSSAAVIASSSAGGLVANMDGTIKNSYATGDVTVTGNGPAGGLAGLYDPYTPLLNVYATGNVSGNNEVGGLVGVLNHTGLINGYATGTVTGTGIYVGGLIGHLSAEFPLTVANSYATGRVNSSLGLSGGLVGGIGFSKYTFSNTFWSTQTSGQSVGVGNASPTGVTGITTAQMTNPFTFINAGWGFQNTWGKSVTGANSGYMMLRPLSTGLYDDYIRVADASRTYGDPNSTISGAALSGIGTGNVTFGWGSAITTSTNAAAYSYSLPNVITVTDAPGRSVYVDTSTGKLTINPRPVIISGLQEYDGGTTMRGRNLTITNLLLNDLVALSGSISSGVASANASPVAQNLLTLSGLNLFNSNYTLVGGSGSVTIVPRSITVTGSKVYDGSATVQGSALTATGLVGIDQVTVGGTGTLLSANAGDQGFASIANLTLSNPNYSISSTFSAVTVTPRPVILSGTKVYDGSTVISGASLTITNLVQGDTVTASGLLANGIASPNAGPVAQNLLSFNGLALRFNSFGNYTLTGGSASVTVTQRPITVDGIAGVTKVYDGTNALPLSAGAGYNVGGLGFIPGDAVSLTGTAAFNSSNVVGADRVSVAGIALSGAGASNYILQKTDGLNAAITPKQLVFTGSKVYDGTPTFDKTQLSFSGTVAGESITLSSAAGTATSANVGTSTDPFAFAVFRVVGGNQRSSNYINPSFATLEITQRPIVLTGTADVTKVYDGTRALPLTAGLGYTVGGLGLVAGDGVSIVGSAAFNSLNVSGANVVSLAGVTLSGAGVSNYAFTKADGLNASITPKQLTVSGSKVYDNTTGFNSGQLSVAGSVNGDTIVLTAGSARSPSVNVGGYINVPLAGLAMSFTGGNAFAANYSLPAAGTLSILPRQLTLTGASGVTKVYDGTTALPASAGLGYTVGGLGLVAGDGVSFSGAAAFNSPDVGQATTLSLGGVVLTGAAAGNYTVRTTAGLNASITPKPLIVTGSKVYDGTAAFSLGDFTLSGVINNEDIRLSGARATATDANVGSHGQTGVAVFFLVSGANASLLNYSSSFGPLVITPRPITLTGSNGVTKVYDGTSALPVTAGLGYTIGGLGFVAGDGASLAGTAAFNAPNVASANIVSLAGVTLSGAAASNYTLTRTDGTNASITPRSVVVAGSRAYDGTTTVQAGTLTVTNGVLNDVVTISGSIANAVASPNASPVAQNLLTLSGLTLSNSNYTTSSGAGSFTITPRAITVSANDQARFAGLPNPPLTYTIGGAGLVVSESLTGALATSATPVSVPGNYSIDQGTLAASPNYVLSYVPGTIVVNYNPSLSSSPSQYAPASFIPQAAPGTGTDTVTCDAAALAARLRATGTARLFGYGPADCGN